MEYGFTLNWEELSEELREQKISDYLAYLKRVGDPMELGDVRYRAEQHIKDHFPIYF